MIGDLLYYSYYYIVIPVIIIIVLHFVQTKFNSNSNSSSTSTKHREALDFADERQFDIEEEIAKLKEMNMFSKKKKEEKLTPITGTPIVASQSTSSGSLMSTNGGLEVPQSPPVFTGRQCAFKKFGCSQYIVSKAELDSHMKEDAQFHLQLVVEKFDHQFDLHTQLMAHFTEQMEDQLEKIMKVVRNHMDTFGNQIQVKIDEGVEKSISFAKKVEQGQQQLAKRLITQQIVQSDQKKLGSPLAKGLLKDGSGLEVISADGASSVNVKQIVEIELQGVQNKFKRELNELTDELNRVSDMHTRDKKYLEDSIVRRSEMAASAIESSVMKKIEEREKRKTEGGQLALETKIDAIRDKLKVIENQQIESSSEIRKLKLEKPASGSAVGGNISSSSPVFHNMSTGSISGFIPSSQKETSFQKSEVMEEIKKLEDKMVKKIQEENNNGKSELADIHRLIKQNQTDFMDLEKDCKNQFDKQGKQVKLIEDELKKTDSLLLLMQNNLKKYNEYVEKEKDRENERNKLIDQIKTLENNQKRIEAEIQEGNEQVERVLREEVNSGSNSPVASSTPKSPLLMKRGSMIISPSGNSPKTTETKQSSLEDGENGILWEYDPVGGKWVRLAIKLKVERKPFAEGALREAYHTVSLGVTSDEAFPMSAKHSFPPVDNISSTTRNEAMSKLKSGTKFVLKLYKKEAESQTSRELYFEDTKMQMVCRDWGDKFNQKKPPKKIEFLMSWVVELIDRPNNSSGQTVLCCIEPLLVGEFKKNNSNYGAVLNNRSTPQAFSHFTYENSNKQLIIVDIQGVDDLYTDPQIHTNDGKGFGLGNLGKTGINKFITTHKCNAVCALLDLDVKLGGVLPSNKKQLQGTMVMPEIVSDLDQSSSQGFSIKIGAKDLPKAEFNKKDLKCLYTIQSFRERVNCITFFDQKNLLCAGYGDGTFRIFDLNDSYKCLHTVPGHRKSIESICSNSQYIFTSSPDHSIKVHSLRGSSVKCMETLIGHTSEVSSIVCNEKYLFSCSYDKTIKVWDLSTFKEIKSFDGVHTKFIKTLALSGRYLFSGGNDQIIYVWDTETFTCLFNMQGHEDWVLSLHCSGPYLFSTSKDNVIKIWDLNDFHCIDTLKGHWNSVSSAAVKDRYLYSGSEDNSIKVWDLDTLECVYTVQKGHSLGIKSLLIYNNQIISSAFDGSIKIWDWQSK